MPAPRLLDKKLVNASLAQEQRREIDKGIKIAKSIDALRATLAEEEEKLERFRTETVTRVHVEINDLLKERDSLRQQIIELQALITEYGRK